MKRLSRTLGAVVAAGTAITLVLSGCVPTGSQAAAAPQTGGPPPTLAEIHSVSSHLPTGEAEAAQSLVNTVFGADRRASLAATAELLVRSGIGLTNDKQQLALASDEVIADALVPLAYIPVLNDSLIRGDFFDGAHVATLFQDLGVTTTPASSDVLLATMRGWGKDQDAEPQVRMAGNLVRALAAHDGALPLPGATPRFDAVQLYLLFAQLVGTVVDYHSKAQPKAAGPDFAPVSYVTTELSGEEAHCEAELKRLEKLGERLKDKAEKKAYTMVVTKGVGWAIRGGLTKGLNEEFLAKYSQLVGKSFKAVSSAVSAAQTVATTLLMMTGLAIDVTDDHGHKMHFRHKHGDTAANIHVAATVSFDSSLVDQDEYACYKLIGLDIPKNGTVSGKNEKGQWSGWQVHWAFGENIGRNNYYGSTAHGAVIRPQQWDAFQRNHQNQHLDENGKAVMETMTRTEKEPNKGTEHKVNAEVVATVDYVTKLKPSLSTVSNVIQVIDMTARAITFPSARHTIEVTYHGQDTYVMTGHGQMNMALLVGMTFDSDYYSCNGLNGPWKGRAAYSADTMLMGDVAGMLGYEGAKKGNFANDTTQFSLDPKVTEPQKVDLGEAHFGVQVTLKNAPKRGEHIDGYVGEGTWLLSGSGVALDSLFNRATSFGVFSSGMTYDVRGVQEDPRCPGAKFEDDTWDD